MGLLDDLGSSGGVLAVLTPQILDDRGERLAFHILHRIVVHAAVAAHIVDGHDVLMLETGRRLRLVLEALQLPLVERGGERQDFERHPPVQGDLFRLVDDAHAAAADLAE